MDMNPGYIAMIITYNISMKIIINMLLLYFNLNLLLMHYILIIQVIILSAQARI